MEWCRLYHSILDSDKIQSLPDPLYRLTINLWGITTRYDGRMPKLNDLARILQIPSDTLIRRMEELVERGVLDRDEDSYLPHDWQEWQPENRKSKSAAERMRELRRRKKQAASNSTVTPVTNGANVTQRDERDERVRTETNVTNAPNESNANCDEVIPENTTPTESTMERYECSDRSNSVTRYGRGEEKRREEKRSVTNARNAPNAPNGPIIAPVSENVNGWDLSDRIIELTDRLIARHNPNRLAPRTEIERALSELVAPLQDPYPTLKRIDRNHRDACASQDWLKDSGQFTPNLVRWLKLPGSITEPKPTPTSEPPNLAAPPPSPDSTPDPKFLQFLANQPPEFQQREGESWEDWQARIHAPTLPELPESVTKPKRSLF